LNPLSKLYPKESFIPASLITPENAAEYLSEETFAAAPIIDVDKSCDASRLINTIMIN